MAMKRGSLRSHRGLHLTLNQQVGPGRSAHVVMLLRSSRSVYTIRISSPPGIGLTRQRFESRCEHPLVAVV